MSYTNDIIGAFEGLKIGSVLDVACGNARHLVELRAKYPKAILRGCDIAKNELENSRIATKGLNIRVKYGDMLDLKYRRKSFDAVLICAALILVKPENISNVANSLKEIATRHIIVLDKHSDSETPEGTDKGDSSIVRVSRNYKALFNLPVSYEADVSPWGGKILRFDL